MNLLSSMFLSAVIPHLGIGLGFGRSASIRLALIEGIIALLLAVAVIPFNLGYGPKIALMDGLLVAGFALPVLAGATAGLAGGVLARRLFGSPFDGLLWRVHRRP